MVVVLYIFSFSCHLFFFDVCASCYSFCVFLFTFILFSACSNQVARETNEELRGIETDPAEGFDVGAILSIAQRYETKEENIVFDILK